MSYDLNFWRYADETVTRSASDHRDVYLALCDGKVPDGLEPLPVAKIEARFKAAMASGWTSEGSAWVRPGAVVEQQITPHWVRLDLRGKLSGDDVNPLIDAMVGVFRCPLYDPQVRPIGERFALPGEAGT